MAGNDVSSAMGELGKVLGMQLLQNLPSYLSAESMVKKAEEILAAQIRETIIEILNDPDSSTTSNLVERFYQELNDTEIIDKIAKPLADKFAEYMKDELWSEVVAAIVKETVIDEDDLLERVAAQLATRVRLEDPQE